MSPTKLMHLALAVMTAAAPALLIMFVFAGTGGVDVPGIIDPTGPNYPDAVERLEATSQTLVTIVLAILAATGFLLSRAGTRSLLHHFIAAAIFVLGTLSMFFSTKLGYLAALTLATGQGDITTLLSTLDNQAICGLLAGSGLAGMVAAGGLDVDKT